MDILLDEEDRSRFLETLRRFKETNNYELYAYCLMRNHVHLLLKEVEDTIQRLMKRVGVSYVYYFNQKYDRVGHLFQDRYKSEVIDTEQYFLGCIRYIHNNPVAAGLVRYPDEYLWSSYPYYLAVSDNGNLLNIDFLLDHFSNDRAVAVLGLKEFTKSGSEDQYLEYETDSFEPGVPRTEWRKVLTEILERHNFSLEDLRTTRDKSKRTLVLQEIKLVSSFSLRELSRLLGISKDTIFRA